MEALKFAISAFALAISSAAAAENLIRFGQDVDGTIHYYDSDTIKIVSGGYVNVWITMDASKDKTVKWRTSKLLTAIDCDKMNFEFQYYVQYDGSGRVLDQGRPGSNLNPAVPGTHSYYLVEAVCSRYQ